MKAAPENPTTPLPTAIAPVAPTTESWVLNLQAQIANLEKLLDEQKHLLSQLDGDLQNGRIERDRFDEMERSGLDRIAELGRILPCVASNFRKARPRISRANGTRNANQSPGILAPDPTTFK